MERTISPEEKIRRAQEIYARRKEGYEYRRVAKVSVNEHKNYGLLKKMLLQIVICLMIYFIFYLIQNSNYIFSEDVLNKAREILSYDIDVTAMFSNMKNAITNGNSGISEEANDEENNITNTIEEEQVIENNENAIGGAEIEITEELSQEEVTEQISEQKPQTDEEYIKANFSFVKPVQGIVSSEFGQRDVANPIVSKNHTGIDIAANKGTQVIASMEGTVTVSSTIGDYGYHIKIKNGDVETLYAHCSKLCVNVGDNVSQGQKIAEVGSTGKSTGPHLHFEIVRNGNYINPRNILDF